VLGDDHPSRRIQALLGLPVDQQHVCQREIAWLLHMVADVGHAQGLHGADLTSDRPGDRG
jgi:hypothetical protein